MVTEVQQDQTLDIAHQLSDRACDDAARAALEAPDETRAEAQQRKRHEERAAKLRAKLSTRGAKGAYGDLVVELARITDAEHRVLSVLLKCANPDLSQCFISHRAAAAKLGMKVKAFQKHFYRLKKIGLIDTQEFRRDDGTQSPSGIIFCLPADVLPGGWRGPELWDNRRSPATKRTRNLRRTA